MPGLVQGKQHSAAWLILPYPSDRAHGRICVCPSPPPPYNQSTHEKIALKVETEHGRTWTYLDRLAGCGRIDPLYRTLRWMVQQLNFEHFQVEDEEHGEILSLSIGRDAVLEEASSA